MDDINLLTPTCIDITKSGGYIEYTKECAEYLTNDLPLLINYINMKINSIELKKTFSYPNVLIEKNEPGLTMPISCFVCKDYKIDNVIGIARPRYLNGAIICNIDVFEDCSGLFPCICFNIHPDSNMIYLSLGIEPNIDNSIKAL